MTTYVCGFLFSPDLNRVVLIRKNRGPRQMAGKFNGIGGKIEIGESPRGAMSREFFEEAGVDINPLDWTNFHTERYYRDTNNKVYFMCAQVSDSLINSCQTMESEEVVIVDVWNDLTLNLGQMPKMYNLSYLIPMAISWLNNPDDHFFEG
jgi:8-oxo-dGTP diphosphatase